MHAQLQIWKISVLDFSASMYRRESRDVSFFCCLCDLLYGCDLIEIEQHMKNDKDSSIQELTLQS